MDIFNPIVSYRSGQRETEKDLFVKPVKDVNGHEEHKEHSDPRVRKEEDHMLWTIAVILIILWLLGLVTSYTMGGFIHILLVVAVIVVLVNIIQGRRVV